MKILVTLQINPTLSSPLTYADGGGAIEFAKGDGTITVTSSGRIQYSKYMSSDLDFPPNNLLLDFLNNIGMSIADVSDQYVVCVTPITGNITMFSSVVMREF